MMSKKNKRNRDGQPFSPIRRTPEIANVRSLLDQMVDGKEYGSIVPAKVISGFDVMNDLVKSIEEIETLRGRSCVAYIGNVTSEDAADATVNASDETPFHEMIAQVPADQKRVDILLATNGGDVRQVVRFVNALRPRFDEVDFLIPSICMSSGTLFAMSGDRIWMTDRASLGPIDPQFPNKDGRLVPAQSLMALMADIQGKGDEALANGQNPSWTSIRIIDGIDRKEVGNMITATDYCTGMTREFLKNYKFKTWVQKETSGEAVTEADKKARADEIAGALASHDRWKNHGHSITRDVLWSEVRLKIDHPDAPLDRLMKRFWALCTWMFSKTPVQKCLVSSHYRYLRQQIQIIQRVQNG